MDDELERAILDALERQQVTVEYDHCAFAHEEMAKHIARRIRRDFAVKLKGKKR